MKATNNVLKPDDIVSNTVWTDTINKLKEEKRGVQFMLGVANHINIAQWNIPSWIHVEKQYPRKALECADLALVASGTSTIEAAVF